MSDQLPMKPKESAKGVGNYPFLFLKKKNQRNKFQSAYSDKPQLAISGTNHRVTTPNGRMIDRKLISKPIETCNRRPTTEEPDHADQTAGLSDHHPNRDEQW